MLGFGSFCKTPTWLNVKIVVFELIRGPINDRNEGKLEFRTLWTSFGHEVKFFENCNRMLGFGSFCKTPTWLNVKIVVFELIRGPINDRNEGKLEFRTLWTSFGHEVKFFENCNRMP